MQWIGHTFAADLGAGTALRVYPQMMHANSPLQPMAGGDLLYIDRPNASHIRTDVLQSYQDWAIFRDSAGVCWRMHQWRQGEIRTDVTLVGAFGDWTVEGQVQCPNATQAGAAKE